MTITQDHIEKTFANGQLSQEMKSFSQKWYADKPSGMPSIADALREIQELIIKARQQAGWYEVDKLFREAIKKIDDLIYHEKYPQSYLCKGGDHVFTLSTNQDYEIPDGLICYCGKSVYKKN